MPTKRINACKRTFVKAAAPTKSFGAGLTSIRLRSGQLVGLVKPNGSVPKGVSVSSAVAYFQQTNALSGSTTVTVERANAAWKPKTTTWSNSPGVIAGTVTSDTKTGARGRQYAVDVTDHYQAIANGSPHHGWVVTTDRASRLDLKLLHVVITYSAGPQKPQDLRPSSGAVAVTKPVLRFRHIDKAGDTRLAAVRVQINSTDTGVGVNGWTSPTFDSGWVTTTQPNLDLATTDFPGLSGDEFWLVQTRDGSGLASPASAPVPLTYAPHGALTITGPSGPVDDFTPDVTWTFSATQTAYRVWVDTVQRPGVNLWDTGIQTGATSLVQVPGQVLVDGRTYRAHIRVWDNEDREQIGGSNTYVEAWSSFKFEPTALAPVGSVTVTKDQTGPGALVAWTRTGAVDEWIIERDGKVIARLDADDYPTKTWGDFGAARGEHVYGVRATYGGQASVATTTSWIFNGTDGVWVGDHETGWLRLTDCDMAGYSLTDQATEFEVLGSPTAHRIVHGLGGRSGAVSGVLRDDVNGYRMTEGLDLLLLMKSEPGREWRLVAGSLNQPVHVDSPTWSRLAGPVEKYMASFGLRQVGEFEFEK